MSYFPCKIQYTDTDEIVVVQTPQDIVNERAFKVLETNTVTGIGFDPTFETVPMG